MEAQILNSERTSQRQALLQELRGQSFAIPALRPFFEHLPRAVSDELPQLERDVDDFVENLFPPGKRRELMKKLKAAYFGATWWPYGSLKTIKVSTFLAIWLFAWDDENDSAEFASLVNDYDLANTFRKETVQYIRHCLYPNEAAPVTTRTLNPILAAFKDIAKHIMSAFSQEQINSLYHEFVFWIEMTDLEHRYHLGRNLPPVEKYQEIRMGSGAVGVTLAMIEYCYGMKLPRSVTQSESFKRLWKDTSSIVCTVNDILSLKKEIAQGQVTTLIPLLYTQVGSLQKAVDIAIETISSGLDSFEVTAQRLLEEYPDDPVTREKLQKYILGCKYAITGNLEWSFASGRYKIGAQAAEAPIFVKL